MELNTERDASYSPYCSKDTHPTPNTDHDSYPIAHTPVMIRILQPTLQSQRESCSPHCSHYSHPIDHTAVMTRILQPILVMPRILQSTHTFYSPVRTQSYLHSESCRRSMPDTEPPPLYRRWKLLSVTANL